MIKSFKQKGLEAYFKTESKRGINPDHANKLARILNVLDASVSPKDMDLPGYKLHELSGKDKGTWAVSISWNWRITFRFEGDQILEVDYIDYH